MDIKKFSVSPTGRLHLRDSSDELMFADDAKTLPIAVNLYGPGSKQYAAATSAQQNRIMDRLKRKGKADLTPDQKTAEGAEFLTACTANFENMEYDALTGDDLARAVYSDQSIGFIADQAGKFLGDWSNFSKGSVKN